MKTIWLIFVSGILFFSCDSRKTSSNEDKSSTENSVLQEWYQELLNQTEILIGERIEEKNKNELYSDLRKFQILSEFDPEFWKTDLYLSYKALTKILTESELRDSLNSSNPKIKYYSFLALTEKGKNVFEALKVVLDDTTKIKAQHFCMINETTLGNLCMSKVTDKYHHLKKRYDSDIYQLTDKEKMELDNLLKNRNVEIK